ncbi:MAG: carbon storage regulator [Planctomycetes bacterium]|nr:carbon storage regulator [Planctomycetota bacterium]
MRLGFEADAEVPVHRWEVWERICARSGPDSPTAGFPKQGDFRKGATPC